MQFARGFERAESAVVAAAAVAGFIAFHFSWWWLPALFLVFDASVIGYAVNARLGAITYNAVHCYVAPAALLLAFAVTQRPGLAFLGLLWGFHIAVDGLLGNGLKLQSGFRDTHLGQIGTSR